jgi:hypothetical protein
MEEENKKNEDESGYLFLDGEIIDFERITLKKIYYGRETGALRIRTTPNEIDVDFLAETKPTKEQLETIKKLKIPSRKLFFEIVNKRNKHIKGYGGFDKTIEEMEKHLSDFYSKNLKNSFQLPNAQSLKK